MFNFLAPLALAGFALLSVPVIIHLLKPKRVRTMPFSSLRWLRASQHKLSRRIQWHQVLLFLLRAAFLSLLVLALAKPIFSRRGERRLTDRFIVLDVSRSMRYEQPGAEPPLARGRKIGRALLESGLPGDRATVLLTGHKTVALGPLAEDPTRYVTRLEAATAGLDDTDLSSALAVIRPMLSAPRANAQVEITFVTDNHQGSWSQGAVADFTSAVQTPVTVRLVDVGPSAPRNAWIADAWPIEAGGKHYLHARLGASGNEPQERTLRVKRLAGLDDLAQKVTIAPGAFAEVNLPLPAEYDSQGKTGQLVLEPGDALPEDDSFWLNLDNESGVQLLLLEPETTQIQALQPGHHIRAALEVLGRREAGAVQVMRRTPEAAVASDFAKSDVVVLANVPALSDDRLLALENRVKAGAGLLVFLGPATQPDFYNTKLYHAERSLESLLPRPLEQIASGGLTTLARVEWTHPLLAPLFDPTFGDLARVQARTFYRLGAAPAGDTSQALAWWGDAAPALLEHTYGAGRVLLFNTTANDAWSDLPRRNSFLPLLDLALRRVSHARLSRSFQAGEPVSLPVAPVGHNAIATVTTPSGRRLSPILQPLGAQLIARLDNTDEIGLYALRLTGESGSAETTFVVQAGRGDSIVAKTDSEILRTWWGRIPFAVVHPDPSAGAEQVEGERRTLLWPWLFVLGALVLLAEMYFVHRLCPVMNPAAVGSSVARHGILAPTRPAARQEVVV